jgi:CRISPR-associated endonuclease/helicase Cas3
MGNLLYAHTPNDAGNWHLLHEHLESTAKLAGRFGQPFGAGDICRWLGWVHDAGKASPAFQMYIKACSEGRSSPPAPHAGPGARAGYDVLKAMALSVLGHHAGLHDPAEAKSLLDAADPGAVTAAQEILNEVSGSSGAPQQLPDWTSETLGAEIFIRMCFSALVDADFLDTEAHFSPTKGLDRGEYPPIEWYRSRLAAHMAGFATAPQAGAVHRVRQEVLRCCREKATGRSDAYRLTVPTGGGKTLAGLTFALEHAARHLKDRVIVAIPYTSIIDQTAQVYGGIFGAHNLLEHHSAIEEPEEGEGQTRKEYRRRLAAENWDCPLVVTTTVQLFESLFSNRPSKCRKLHNVANSVIILDEVQTLPVHLLTPILDVLKQLVEHYGVTVVFCTATQPDFSGLGGNVLTRATEIVERPERHFEALRRVCYERLEQPLTHEELTARLDAETQALCVLNSRPDAVRVAKACRPGDDLFHLSTLMCPHHRKKVIAKVRQRLAEGLPVRLISTQVVEAGVDMDFPLVMRVVGPLDRVVQVAGRCNREGLLDGPGRCIVFELADSKAPRGAYWTGIELTRTIIGEEPDRLDQPDVVAKYFRQLYNYAGADQGKGAEIQKMRGRLHFRSVAEEFRLISETTLTVVATQYEPGNTQEILKQSAFLPSRVVLRKLAPYSVAVPVHRFREWRNLGILRQHESGAWLYDGLYDDSYGIGNGSDPDPTDLIA